MWTTTDNRLATSITVGFLCSVAILVLEIVSLKFLGIGCESLVNETVITLDVLLILVSLAGMVAMERKVQWLFCFYVLAMFLLTVLLFCFTIFVNVETSKGIGGVLPGTQYEKYRLGGYSHWLLKRVSNADKWNRTKSCLIDRGLCSKFSIAYSNDTKEEFFSEYLSYLESGCCKPSNDCNFSFVSPIVWTKTDDVVYTNPDCGAWASDPNILCYNCQSCKAGLLENLNKEGWMYVAAPHCLLLVVYVIVFWLLLFIEQRKGRPFPLAEAFTTIAIMPSVDVSSTERP